MANQTPTLEAKSRDRIGSRYARRLRNAGQLPAVIYGHGQDPVAVSVDRKSMAQHLHRGQRVFTLALDGASETCLVKELQFDHLGSEILHVDLARIDLTEEVTIHVALKFTGKPVGLKTPGAILRTILDSLTVSCRASDIPSTAIPVDVSNLDVDHHLTAREVVLPPGLRLEENPEEVVARITIVAEDADQPVAAPEGEPEVITEKKFEEGAEAAPEAKEAKKE